MNLTPLIRCQLNRRKGLTFVELLVALSVSAIVLAAVATLAYAMATANNTADDTSQKQAQVRYATLRISELIRYGRLICGTPGDDLVVWRADDNGDGQINGSELVYIETNPGQNYLRLLEFSSCPDTVALSHVQAGTAKGVLIANCESRWTTLLPECSNVQFVTDVPPPQSRFVSIFFDLEENGITRHYQITGTLRCYSGS